MDEFHRQCALWRRIQAAGEAERAKEARRRRRKRAAQAAVRIDVPPAMVARRLHERTGRDDWAEAVRAERIDGLDVMDFTAADARSIAGLADPKGFHQAVLDLRERLTRPVAEFFYVIREADDLAANWYEAQALLTAGLSA